MLHLDGAVAPWDKLRWASSVRSAAQLASDWSNQRGRDAVVAARAVVADDVPPTALITGTKAIVERRW